MAYVFAQLSSDGILAPDPKYIARLFCDPRPSDLRDFTLSVHNSGVYSQTLPFELLVPESPISWAPKRTFWNRVSQLPPVEYYTGYWKIWEEAARPSVVADGGDDHVSVFVILSSQYEYLKEEHDPLTELRQTTLNKTPSDSPSTAAIPTNFRANLPNYPFEFGRPRSTEAYPLPLSLLQPEFGRFQDDLRSMPLDPSLSYLGVAFVTELSKVFENEADRQLRFHRLIAELLGKGVSIVAKQNSSGLPPDGVSKHRGVVLLPAMPEILDVKLETTGGASSDAVFRAILSYMEGVRMVCDDEEYKGEWRKTRLPSVLVVHNGPNIQILGAVWLDKGYVEVLSHSIPLYFSPYNRSMLEDLLRFMCSFKRLSESICEIYKNPSQHAVSAKQVTYPYPCSYPANIPLGSIDNPPIVHFTYAFRVCDLRLVFVARNEQNDAVIVKFGTERYGVEAHVAAAAAGIAPELLSFQELPGSMWMVVMLPVPTYKGFVPCPEIRHLTASCRRVIQETVARFHDLGFVHGDMRDSNVFVRKREEDKWDCMIIDFDWSGREGDVTYPLAVYRTEDVWRPRPHMDGQVITADDDLLTMKEFLNRRTQIIRGD